MDEKTNSGLSDDTVDKFSEFMKMIEKIETPVGYPLRRTTAHWDLTILDLDSNLPPLDGVDASDTIDTGCYNCLDLLMIYSVTALQKRENN